MHDGVSLELHDWSPAFQRRENVDRNRFPFNSFFLVLLLSCDLLLVDRTREGAENFCSANRDDPVTTVAEYAVSIITRCVDVTLTRAAPERIEIAFSSP